MTYFVEFYNFPFGYNWIGIKFNKFQASFRERRLAA